MKTLDFALTWQKEFPIDLLSEFRITYHSKIYNYQSKFLYALLFMYYLYSLISDYEYKSLISNFHAMNSRSDFDKLNEALKKYATEAEVTLK